MSSLTTPTLHSLPPATQRPLRPHSRRSVDFLSASAPGSRMQHDRHSGAVPLPVGNKQRSYATTAGDGGAGMQLRAAASPPKNKNTQHVPCKFFLQGQCQAGTMCPFSHDIESTTRPAPCKYFAKGGCKFGRKCALLHITQDGTVVNRMPSFAQQQQQQQQQFMASGPMPPPSAPFQQPPPPGLLSMQAQGLEQRPSSDIQPHEFDGFFYGPRNGYDTPQIDMTYTSASPKYGSPTMNDRFAGSPPQKGLSVLDAPLPNSFDSNGISFAARNGPLAASVPSKWDFESPPSSLPRKSQLGNTALRDLHSSAFGDRGMDNLLARMGSSPPSGTDEPISFEKRPLHSDRLRGSRQLISASLGTRLPIHRFDEYSDDEGDGDADREEDLLPSSLHDLIPEGRSRRESRAKNEENSPASFLAMSRRTISGDGKAASPHSSSPSRYTNVFASARARDSFGHVGSPLRDSTFPTSYPTGISANGDLSPSISSPPRQASMSMLTQELQRTKLDAARSASSSVPQMPPAPSRTISSGSANRASMDRAMSSNSVSQRIEEEQELFDMEFDRADAKFGPVGGGRISK